MLMQRPHHRNPRHHWVAIVLADQQQHLDGGLPFRRPLFSLGQLGNVVRGIAERDQRLTAGQYDQIERTVDTKTSSTPLSAVLDCIDQRRVAVIADPVHFP